MEYRTAVKIGSTMRILKIFDGDYPWDVRVEKTLRTLRARGHEVTLLCRNRAGRTRRETINGVEIRRLPHPGGLEPLTGFPAFFHPVWRYAARRTAREIHPKRIFVRDLPLAPLGVWLARRCGVPLLIDMAEPYPEALRSNWQFNDRRSPLDLILRNPSLADAVERWVIRQGPRVLVVAEEAGRRLERLGLAPDAWTLVHNSPELERFPSISPEQARVPAALAGRVLLLFSGILVGDRGVEVAIAGLKEILKERPQSVGLVVIGEGPARARYEACARELGLQNAVAFTGWVPHDELPFYWAGAAIGILPFHTCTHIHTTLANKLFDYMAVGLPIVASDARPMLRVLSQTGAGVTFPSGDASAFARAVLDLLTSPEKMRAMAACGRAAACDSYNWARDAERLVAALEKP